MQLATVTTLLLSGGASAFTLSAAPVLQQQLGHSDRSYQRAELPAMQGNFEGFSLDTLKRSFERMIDLRVARASHILVKGFDETTLRQMEQWKEDIANSPEKFAARAKQSSVCPSRLKSGDLGFFTRGKMVKEFDNVVFTAEPGMVHGPVRTDFGYHLIFIHSCRKPE